MFRDGNNLAVISVVVKFGDGGLKENILHSSSGKTSGGPCSLQCCQTGTASLRQFWQLHTNLYDAGAHPQHSTWGHRYLMVHFCLWYDQPFARMQPVQHSRNNEASLDHCPRTTSTRSHRM
eukprot:3724989-Amphidinium_carterae.1